MDPNALLSTDDHPDHDPVLNQPAVCPVYTDLLVLANIRALQLDLSDRLNESEPRPA